MRKRADGQKRRLSPAVIPLYIWTVLFTLLPLLYVVVLSFTTKSELWGYEWSFTLKNYANIGQSMYLRVFVDSFVIAFLTTVISLLLSYPFSYATSLLPPAWRRWVLMLVMIPFWTNSLVRLYGWIILLRADGVINQTLRNLGIIEAPLKLLYNDGAVLVGMVYALIPFMILSLYNSLEKLDWSIVEAARDLGANRWKAFWTVTLPQTLPGIMAGCVLVFVPSVGLFFVADLMGGGKTMLLGNQIQNELLTARNWPFGAALSVIMLILTFVMLALYKRVTGGKIRDLV